VNNVVGIAETPDAKAYWVLTNDGNIYNSGTAFAAKVLTGTPPVSCGNLMSIVSNHTGAGFWVTDQFGTVYRQGTATNVGDQSAAATGPSNVVSLEPSHDDLGYFLVGSVGGLFAYGDTIFFGSLLGLGISVNDSVGAVWPSPRSSD
jgi:hypothetical protein